MSNGNDPAPQNSDSQPATDDRSLALIEEQAERSIRRVWHDGRWFFSVIDVVGVLTDSPTPRRYWAELKRKLREEGYAELFAQSEQLKMQSADGKYYRTDAADTQTFLRIIQSIPSPKAEPVKQWLARVGARQLDDIARPLDAVEAGMERTNLVKPSVDAPALAWAEYYEQLAVLYRRQAAYEARMEYVDARLDEHEEQIGELHSRVESLEEGTRMLPELLLRLGPQTLAPEHQATVKAMVKRLHDLTGLAYGAIYGDLNESFHVARYGDLPDARWEEVAMWLTVRIKAAEKRRS